MKLKKLVSVALAGVMALSLTACGGSDTAATTAAAAKEEAKATEAAKDAAPEAKAEATGDLDKTIAHVVGQLGDKSFSDSAETGMKVLREEGWDAKTIEVGDATKSDKWEDAILDVLDEGYKYVVGGSTFTDIMLKLSKEYPDNKFVIYDDSLDEELIPENVAFLLYAQNEGSYMVGQMAAGLSETGVIAVNVGMDNPVKNSAGEMADAIWTMNMDGIVAVDGKSVTGRSPGLVTLTTTVDGTTFTCIVRVR